jgi:hypothetical protein
MLLTPLLWRLEPVLGTADAADGQLATRRERTAS